jgi:xanthine dehydrogenase large subunit
MEPPDILEENRPAAPAREASEELSVVRKPFAHDSAIKHVSGQAQYVDDVRAPAGTLHLAPGYAPIAAGRVTSLDLEPVRTAPGVVAVLTAADIPGRNDISPKQIGDDALLAES